MRNNLNGVKMERGYHHGDLRQALIDSALAVLADKGVDGFSLRETARRAGVSPAAYKHHFADTRALMTALAAIAFTRLADALEKADRAAGQSRRARLAAQGAAYIGFALAERASFDLMWRASLLDLSDPKLLAEKTRAFDCLDRLARGADAPRRPNVDPAMAPTIACWSLVNGFARLMLDGGLGENDDRAHSADAILPAMLHMLDIRD
jgi:AcrR family transcriptional regulator